MRVLESEDFLFNEMNSDVWCSQNVLGKELRHSCLSIVSTADAAEFPIPGALEKHLYLEKALYL